MICAVYKYTFIQRFNCKGKHDVRILNLSHLTLNKNSSDLNPLKERFANESRIFLARGIVGENLGRRKRTIIEYSFKSPSERDQ